MTRRERIENRLAKREEWAEKAAKRSAQGFEAARRIADNVPLGQPILVGHHSEGRARRDAARIESGMRKGCEEQELASHHASKASNIADALERTIFDDDSDAIERLKARADGFDSQADKMVAVNTAWRKAKKPTGDNVEAWKAIGEAVGMDGARLAQSFTRARESHWKKDCAPFDGYQMTNLRARARTDRKRIEWIKAKADRIGQADANGGVTVEHLGGNSCRVTFAEKPSREVLDSLREAGFWWRNPSWYGNSSKLPAGIVTD